MTRRIVFVTQDLEPHQPGGAGALIATVARGLAATGHEVTVVHVAPGAADGESAGVRVVGVPVREPDGTLGWFLERSEAAAQRLAALVADSGTPDLVEFNDFEALAAGAVVARDRLGLGRVVLAARLHGPVEAITAAIGAAPPPMDALARIERAVLPALDAVLVPSVTVGDWAAERYGLDAERLVVAPPPVAEVSRVPWSPSPEPSFAAYGRITEQKGVDDLVRAAVPLLEGGATLRFVGPDGWSAHDGRPMSEVLTDLVPETLRSRVVFEGSMPREEALGTLATAWAVVVPSRYETFCLAAHEVRRAGLPVVAAPIPPFLEYRQGAGMLLTDGTVGGLTDALRRIAADRSVAAALVAEPPPTVGDPLAAYAGPLPEPRHPRSQAGMATLVSVEMESLRSVPPSRWTRAAQRALRAVPRPLARLAVRLLPRRVKDRFRTVASWPREQERREADRRLRRMRAAAVAGEFPEDRAPDVSVVIPCFEQGEWVTGAVLSVFEQTHRSWEVVLVDDGSADSETIRALDELAAWPRVRLIRQENQGLSSARNAGMAAARGRFLVPLDADDELHPRFMEVLARRLDAEPEAAFAHCWAELFGDVEGIWATRPFNPYWELLSNSVVGCVLMRRSAWEAVGGYDETMRDGNEDWEMWVRLRGAGWAQARVTEPLFRYRKHGVSMSVISEGEFERGRAQIRDRHPDRYEAAAVRALKQEWYPLLTVIDDRAGEHARDVVLMPGPAADAVAAARSKYVADRREAAWPIAVAESLADRLESEPSAAWAHDPATGAVVWRRWCLVDPGADPTGGLGPEPPEGDLAAGRFPDPEWTVAGIAGQARLFRHRPEEDGRLPAWVVS